MPLPAGTKYRYKTYPNGKKVRLAFDKAGEVIEVKDSSGKLHELRKRKGK